jgi:PPOX class probable F420-dependent enzyme
MAANIPDVVKELCAKPVFAHLATLTKDGGPQVTPVWIDFDGSLIWINTAKNRIKDQNMRRDKRVAISILDPDNAYRHVAIRGEVAEITENGADAHIDAMAKKYLGKDRYPFRSPSEVRVIYKIRPVKVATMG